MGTWGGQTFLFRWRRRCTNIKSTYLFEAFQSQHAKRWFERETFMGLMRIRGMESNSPSGYAEAFHARKSG